MKKFALGLAAFIYFTFLVPIPSSANAACTGSECVVSFQYTGTEQQWSVPAGATNIRFFIYGASGARGGGGGSVTGVLNNLPSVLYLYVGGQGSQGRNASGGFNGGGSAGGNRGNEGSGGGASDIRSSQALSSRIVVAGGGGGGGGYSGAAGAAGGGLEAAAGGSGQGGGGGGGTQVSGGGAGFSNGGSSGTSGTFGQGGTGGTSWNAGGGGGGGGWYGGGGGGADDNDCCADGGGGGGGSSYANSSFTQNVSHAAGVNAGHGRIEIHYTLIPIVTSFSGAQASSVSATFTLVVSEAITNLDQSDFIVSGCTWQQLSVTGNSATITLASCSHGNVILTLKASSIGALQNGPPQPVVAAIQFDGQAPSFNWNSSGGAFSQSSVVLGFSLQDATVSSIAQFDLGGCQGELLDLAVRIFGCPDGAQTISFAPNQLSDSWGNSGPASAVSYQVVFDQTAPVATWFNVEITGNSTFSYSAQVNFSESVSFSVSSVVFTSSMECISGHSIRESGWLFWAECGHGSGSWLLPAVSLMDALGNFGPVEPVSVSFENLAPPPPAPVSVPATESPTSTTQEQTQSQVVTTPPQEPQNPQPTQPPVTEPVTQAPLPEPAPQPEHASDPEPVEPVIEAPVSESPVIEEAVTGSEEVEVAPVSFDGVPLVVLEDKAQEVISQQRPTLPKLSEPEVLEPGSVSESPILDDSSEEDQPIQLAGGEFTFRQEDEFPILPVALGALALILLLGLVVVRISGR
jgi:hypothetical protein